MTQCGILRWRSGIPAAALFILTRVGMSHADTPGCPTLLSSGPTFQKGATIYYDFASNVTSAQQIQINFGTLAWTQVNFSNGSHIVFTIADSTHPASLRFVNYDVPTDWLGSCEVSNFHPGSSTTLTIVTFNTKARCGAPKTFMYQDEAAGANTVYFKTTVHELGHGHGLDHPAATVTSGLCDSANSVLWQQSVMDTWPCGNVAGPAENPDMGANVNDIFNIEPTSITSCDCTTVSRIYSPPPPPPPGGGGGGGGCPKIIGVPGENVPQLCNGCTCSPIVIDVNGDGFDFTDAEDGVLFDIAADGHPQQLSWLSVGGDDAFLVLDRNGNGLVDDGSELFGDSTPQPASDAPNGFAALAVFDAPDEGGNGDGKISAADAIYSRLRLWRDMNHNGISEPAELYDLRSLGVKAIELDYDESERIDENGNRFRYRARIQRVQGADDGRWAYDVFLIGR